jgi:hypothetical protein
VSRERAAVAGQREGQHWDTEQVSVAVILRFRIREAPGSTPVSSPAILRFTVVLLSSST